VRGGNAKIVAPSGTCEQDDRSRRRPPLTPTLSPLKCKQRGEGVTEIKLIHNPQLHSLAPQHPIAALIRGICFDAHGNCRQLARPDTELTRDIDESAAV
jgi:hypothetical protein